MCVCVCVCMCKASLASTGIIHQYKSNNFTSCYKGKLFWILLLLLLLLLLSSSVIIIILLQAYLIYYYFYYYYYYYHHLQAYLYRLIIIIIIILNHTARCKKVSASHYYYPQAWAVTVKISSSPLFVTYTILNSLKSSQWVMLLKMCMVLVSPPIFRRGSGVENSYSILGLGRAEGTVTPREG